NDFLFISLSENSYRVCAGSRPLSSLTQVKVDCRAHSAKPLAMPRHVSVAVSDRSALTEVLADLLRANPKALVLAPGECAETDALLDEFGGERVRVETTGAAAIVSVAIGAARGGYRPVVIIPTMDDLALGLDPLAAEGSKLPADATQRLNLPIVLLV